MNFACLPAKRAAAGLMPRGLRSAGWTAIRWSKPGATSGAGRWISAWPTMSSWDALVLNTFAVGGRLRGAFGRHR